MSELRTLIADHRFSHGLNDAHVDALLACAELVHFDAGQLIFAEDAVADVCYLIVEGDISVEVDLPGKERTTLQTLHGGDVLGWSWLFPPFRWTFGAHARSDAAVIALDADRLRQAKFADPELGYQLLYRFSRVLVDRLQSARHQLLDMYGRRP